MFCRSFEILLVLRHVDGGRIETTLFINSTVLTPPELAQAARGLGGSVLQALDAATPITDQIEAAHRVIDDMIEKHGKDRL
jgi:hypothetical protein